MAVEIGTDSFSLIATLPGGFRVSFGQRQTHPRQAGRSRVTRAKMRLSLVHEESIRGEIVKADRSPTTIMVPSWQEGQRLRSMPVIFSSKSLAERWGHCSNAGSRSNSLSPAYFTPCSLPPRRCSLNSVPKTERGKRPPISSVSKSDSRRRIFRLKTLTAKLSPCRIFAARNPWSWFSTAATGDPTAHNSSAS